MQRHPNWAGTLGNKRRSADTGYEESSGCPARIHVRSFWERQGSAFFDVRGCYPNAESYRGHKTNLPPAWEREEENVRQQGARSRNRVPLLHWYLLPKEEWQMNARGITVDWLNFYQPRRERIIVLQCHGFAPASFALLNSALLFLRRLTLYTKCSAEHYK